MPACATWGCVCVCLGLCVTIQIAYLCVCHSSSHRHAYGCLIVCVCVVSLSGWVPTAAPVGHLSSQSYQQGSCNLAANLIIQIAEYLMVLNRRVKKK